MAIVRLALRGERSEPEEDVTWCFGRTIGYLCRPSVAVRDVERQVAEGAAPTRGTM